jgi:hypothetical protein
MDLNKNPHWLLEYSSNTYSQTGEDGIIAKILSLLPETDRWCVEFGAWDGIHLSNVRKLISESQYSAVMIEGDADKFQALKNNYSGNPNVHAVNAFVGFERGSSLDKILSAFDIPINFDFLSIDIDGNDYYAWEAVEAYRPKVVCIEFNPTIPSEAHFVQPANPRINQGCSVLALEQLAHSMGYQLVCVLPWNAIFVDEKYFARFGIADNSVHALRKDLSQVTWLFSGYDGSVHLAGAKRLPWHGIREIDERRMQVLPRILQSYPPNYTNFQEKLFRLMRFLGLIRQ